MKLALLSEETRRKSMITSQVGEAYNVRDSDYGNLINNLVEANLERDLWNVITVTKRVI